MDTKIILGNCTKDDNDLIVQPDTNGISDYIALKITVDNDAMPLSAKELDPDDGSETYFHINKAQAEVLISYLKSLIKDM